MLAVVFITLAVAFMGFQSSGSLISHLDIANNYAGWMKDLFFCFEKIDLISLGTLVGITNTLAAVPGFVGPAFVGWITNKNVSSIIRLFALILSIHSANN